MVEWTIPAIIGVTFGAIGTVESGLFMFGAINSLDAARMPTRPELGKPWSAWIQSGLDGATNRTIQNDDRLEDAGGPFPNIYLFNDVGDYLGKPFSKNDYVKHNTVGQISIYPNTISTDEGQDATIAIISARDGHRDGLLITEIAFGLEERDQFRSGPYGITSDTVITCGAAWYPSGVYRRRKDGVAETVQGFWFGGEHGIGAMQIHGPSFIEGLSQIDYEKYLPGKNGSHDDVIRDFCQHPARLGMRTEPFLEKEVRKSVFTDFDYVLARNSRTAPNSGEYMSSSMRYSGHPKSHNGESSSGIFARSVDLEQETSIQSHKRKLLTVVDNEIGISAKQVCQSPTAVGPDYVNTHEGLFCRMEDREMFPVCDSLSPFDGNNDNAELQDGQCFDMETRQIGWLPSHDDVVLAKRSGQFRSRVSRKRLAQRSQVVYDGELRSGGDGWELNT